EEVAGRSDVDVAGAALAHRHLAAVRRPGESKVHVYSPNAEEHGWESPHTVVQTVVDDMPFLVDSISMEVTRDGHGIHLGVRPILAVRRDGDGRLLSVGEGDPESLIHLEIDRQTDPALLEALHADLVRVLGDVRAAVEDWPAMTARAVALADEL